jgi:D-methionine transport system substrate-binding protein
MRNAKKLAAAVLTALLTLSLAACSAASGQASTSAAQTQAPESEAADVTAASEGSASGTGYVPSADTIKVTIGTTSDDPTIWDALQKELDNRGDNIKIEYVVMDGGLLNQAVADGELDLNSFQHYAYFNQVVKDQKLPLTAIGETLIVPLDLFSKKYTSLDELPDSAVIALPADATNQGRALNVLQNAGLITLDPDVGNNALISDVVDNPKNIKFYELDGSQIARSLDDVDAAVINCGYAVDAGLDLDNPLYKDEIDLSDPQQQPYINIIVAKTSDVDNPVYQEVVDAYQSQLVYDATIVRFGGAAIPAFTVD